MHLNRRDEVFRAPQSLQGACADYEFEMNQVVMSMLDEDPAF